MKFKRKNSFSEILQVAEAKIEYQRTSKPKKVKMRQHIKLFFNQRRTTDCT